MTDPGNDLTWVSKYWDNLDQLYWTPKYLGLRSIPQSQWERRDGYVCVPEQAVNPTGPLYRRAGTAAEQFEILRGSEEILNHLFDITFAIAPDAVVEAAFLRPLGLADQGPFQSIGREARRRYGWGKSENVTQHDGLFVSERSAIAVEIKLDALSSPEQIAKYVGLLAWECLATHQKKQLGLLYIVPNAAAADHWRHCGLNGPQIERSWLSQQRFRRPLPKTLASLLADQPDLVDDVVDRMTLHVITWSDLYATLEGIRAKLDHTLPGDQTLARLLDGFLAQLRVHRGAL